MKGFVLAIVLFSTLIGFEAAIAEPEYTRLQMEIEVGKPADELWAIAGGYCDISLWANIECEIVSGSGNIGTVRVLLGGAITEVMVAKTALSYGYATPVKEGEFYDLSDSTSKLLYTIVYDVSDFPDQAAKNADMTRRRDQFDKFLLEIKRLTEK